MVEGGIMTYRTFKIWLEGYLAGCGGESFKDLTREQLAVIVEKFSELEAETTYKFPEERVWPITFSSGTYTIKNLVDEVFGK